MSYISYGIESFNKATQGSQSGNYSLGIRFQLTEERNVSGFRVFSNATSGSVTVKLWDSNKNLIASATGQRVKNDWATFTLDSNITLSANTEYRLAYYTRGSLYEWFNSAGIVTSDGFTFLGGCQVSGDAYPNNNDDLFWGLDLVFDDTPDYDIKYLVKSDNTVYTTKDNVLTSLGVIGINADVFRTYGTDEIPEWSTISGLINPEILCWYDTTDIIPKLNVNMKAVPKYSQQNIITDAIDLTHTSITGIESATVTCEGNPLFAVSFDNKLTWFVWNGTEWVQTFEEFSGMTKELLESITTSQWMSLYTGADNFYIRVSLLDTESKLTKIYIDFAN